MDKKVIGILGGMGPLATADFFTKLVKLTAAKADSEHPRVVMDNNPSIPDRTAGILGLGKSPLAMLKEGVANVEGMGAQVIAIPCNTAHYYYDDFVGAAQSAEVLSILKTTVEAVKRRGYGRPALLATVGTYNSGIYQRAFEAAGIELVVPEGEEQKFYYNLAYMVKQGDKNYPKGELLTKLQGLYSMGADCFILGCTEIPVAFDDMGISENVIDTSLELARAALIKAGYEVTL